MRDHDDASITHESVLRLTASSLHHRSSSAPHCALAHQFYLFDRARRVPSGRYTTAAFGWLDVTLATVSVFEESTAGSDHGRVRCSLYMAAPQDEERGPWKAIGTKPGGDDLITPGQPGSFDWGLCYSTPPMQAEAGQQHRLFYWGVDGEHCASCRSTVRSGAYIRQLVADPVCVLNGA